MGKKIYSFDNVFMKKNEDCYALCAQALVRKAMKGYNEEFKSAKSCFK